MAASAPGGVVIAAPAPPLALLEAYGAVWVAMHGGRVDTEQARLGDVVTWHSADGGAESLPGRMYGVARATGSEWEPDDLPDHPVGLPPGARVQGVEPWGLVHRLVASSEDAAWSALARVGRQGVRHAVRAGLTVREGAGRGSLDLAADYLELAALKASRLGGPPPTPAFLEAVRDVFGDDGAGLVVSAHAGRPAAAVLWVVADRYGMLVDGASDPALWRACPNNLAVWTAVRTLVARGVEVVDYGFSPVGAGDARFKAHMGGRPEAVSRWPGRQRAHAPGRSGRRAPCGTVRP